MFRSILSAAVVAGLGVSAAQGAVTWDWKYDANATPGVSGSVTKDDGTPWSAFSPAYSGYTPPVSTASGGLYDASTLGTDNIGGWEYPVGPSNMAYFNSDTGYTVEWKMRINEIDEDYNGGSNANGGLGSIGMELEDGRSAVKQWFFLSFLKDNGQYKTYFQGSNMNTAVIANIDNTSFHTYRVTVLGTTGTLYLDGNLVGTVTDPRTDIASDLMRWSDSTGANDASYTVDYLYANGQGAFAPVAVPEPAVLGLLALGGLALVRRRRA